MIIKEKIQHNGQNEIRLYKEGVFWVAYEQSAYWVHLQKGYKATKRFVKTANQEVVSAGFPDSALAGIMMTEQTQASTIQKTEKMCIIVLKQTIDMEKFEVWKKRLSPQPPDSLPCQITKSTIYSDDFVGNSPPEEKLEKVLIEQLRNFDISNATPMACMVFLSEMQKALRTA
ncbi:MAG: hypothetical protein LBR75_01750 [Prevotellaceae bacterium]|jgi:hypothetical protein|nr:hypothetical protein [Prevotellaceae bacterium]